MRDERETLYNNPPTFNIPTVTLILDDTPRYSTFAISNFTPTTFIDIFIPQEPSSYGRTFLASKTWSDV
jgi:hypothetical protein